MKLFKVENHIIELDRDEIRLIPEFAEILVRDKGKRGLHNDADARGKVQAYKEFKYIYFLCDYKSPYVNYSDKERERFSKSDSNLEDNWKPDNTIKLAMDKYRSLQETPSMKILNSLQRGLMLSSSVVDTVCDNIQNLLDRLNSDQLSLQGKELDPISAKIAKDAAIIEQMEITNALVTKLSILQELGSKIPKTLDGIEILVEKVKKETDGDNMVRGGKKKGNRADPKTN